ncbi:hypothetical protein DN062_02260 [Nitrincola tibetensis]|uniref:Uncharacterized protein n=2 Tax=Nitrincola tibetensis TaxID=2219697 RepID=A0A364NSP7_9GAMM|nr:hypothetical protein DN062_02260 [Nitrincola tibetensis]
MVFDAFNSFLSKFSAVSIDDIEPNKTVENSWNQSCSSPWLYQTYGTGVVYLDSVRFEDSSFWYFDESEVLDQIKLIEDSLTKDSLKDKK